MLLSRVLLLAAILLGGWLPAAASHALPAFGPQRPLRVVLDDRYPPLTFRAPDGTLQGILVDQWAQWQARTGIPVQLDAMDWAEAQRRMEEGAYDVIDTLFLNPERQARYDYLPPYMRIEVPIFFSRDLAGIRGPRDLAGFIVGAKRGDNSIDLLKAAGVTNFLLFDNYEAIVRAARDGKVKVFTMDQPPALYYLIKFGIQDQFRASPALYSGDMHRAVRRGDTALRRMVQHGFEAIPKGEYQAIERRWYGLPLFSRGELRITAFIAGGAIGLTGLLLAWVWSLKRMVGRRTAELRTSQAYTEVLFNSVHDAVFVADPDGRILDFNSRAVEVFGYGRERLLASDLGGLSENLPDYTLAGIRSRLDAVRQQGQALFEWMGRHADGHTFPLEIAVRSDRSGGGERFIIAVRDISERTRIQAQLLQAQKMESLGSLAGGVAHDMNNVLGAILAIASFNLDQEAADSSRHRALETIAKAATRGGQMVRSLLNFARQTPVEEAQVDLNSVLGDVAQLLERTTLARINLQLDLARPLRPVRGDASSLAHSIMNLCVNAVDAMPGAGTLTLRTRNLGADQVEVVVGDSGTGMSPEVLAKAVEPFFTTKEVGKGTGLGLSMVYGVVKAHLGTLELWSEEGHGTRVTLRFPASGGPAGVPEQAAAAPAAAHTGLRVLLVDDDELIVESLGEILGLFGHATTAVASGEEALAQLKAGLVPDLVILDMNMPGLGGAATLPHLRRLCPATPVVLTTGKADQAALDLVAADPFVTLLAKPFTMEELRRHLERLPIPGRASVVG